MTTQDDPVTAAGGADPRAPDPSQVPLHAPPGPPDPLAAGYALRDAGAAAAAELTFREAAARDPDDPEAHGALAELLQETGRHAEAAEAFARAAARDPSRTRWLAGLVEALDAAGRLDAAVEAQRRLLALRPDSAAAHRTLGRLLARCGDLDGAIEHHREARFLDPHDSRGGVDLGRLLLAAGQAPAAVEVLQAVLRREEDPDALFELGRAWEELGEWAKARAAWERCRATDPVGRPDLDAAIARTVAQEDRLTAGYVRTLFDQYADRFDADLTGRLAYRAPEQLRDAVVRLVGTGAALDVLDLGCGTGLAGLAFRPLARRLEGVDLAPRMVERARARGIYDALHVADAVAALAFETEAWDLVLAADVLVYVGALGPLLSGVRSALRPGGHFAATVERHDGAGYRLQPTRRFAHSEPYLREEAARAGLEVVAVEPIVPRLERREPVPGLLVLLRRAGRRARSARSGTRGASAR